MTKVISMRGLPAGWDADDQYVYIGRAGKGVEGYFGNPFPMVPGQSTREESIDAFRVHFNERMESDPEFKARVLALQGKKLVCFCKPLACHGDVIAEHLNSLIKPVWD